MTLKTAIKKRNVSEIRKITKTLPVADIADKLEQMTTKEQVVFFSLLNSSQQGDIFVALEPKYQEMLIKAFNDKDLKGIVEELYSDDLVDIIEEVPSKLASRIIKVSSKETRTIVNKLLRFEENETGSRMSTDIISFKQSQTVSMAKKIIKEQKNDAELVHYFYVTDSQGKLVGSITIEDLLFANHSTKLKTLIRPTASVTTKTDVEETANKFADHNRSVMPVVNSTGYLVGMITADDVIDIIQEVATEDIEKMAGITHSDTEKDKSYLLKSSWRIFLKRVIWLMLLMISSTVSQIVLDAFQGISIDKLDHGTTGATTAILTTAIVAILPVISGAAGNAGSQSSTTIIRALATGDITTKDYLKVFSKELKVSTITGITLAMANFIRLIIYYAAKGQAQDIEYIALAGAASLSLFAVIVLAKVVGGMLPILAKKVKLDPAVMAAPLLTTIIDALSTMIFFGISIGILMLVV